MKNLWALVMVGVSTSCGGTETDNPVDAEGGPLVHFEDSACKRGAPMDPGEQPLVVSEDAEGWQCFAWERGVGDALALRLLNFDGTCVQGWDGEARRADDGALELVIVNTSCNVASCGSCLYDFDYELSVADEQELPVRVAMKNCGKDETIWTYEVNLPLEEASSGSLCRPIPSGPLGWYALTTDRCGTYNMPCGEECQGSSGCDAGLTCTALGEEDLRCLEACSADDDCSSPLTSCQDQVCLPTDTF